MTPALLLASCFCPWSFCFPPSPRTNEAVHSRDFDSAAWGAQSFDERKYVSSYVPTRRGEHVTTAYPKLLCDWSDEDARTFARWRDFRLHASHEDLLGGVCESHRLWPVLRWDVDYDDASEGVYIPRGGGHVHYEGRTRTCNGGRPREVTCCESGEARASRCVETHTIAFGDAPKSAYLPDPKGCP